MKKNHQLFVAAFSLLLIIGFAACSNAGSGESGEVSRDDAVAVYKGVKYQGENNTHPLYLTYKFFDDDSWVCNCSGEIDFFGYYLPCDYIGYKGSYSGNPAVDGTITMRDLQKADINGYKGSDLPNKITSDVWPLKDVKESKREPYDVIIKNGKFTDHEVVFTRQ